ncbi:MAG: accessory factor UbiK family protein [Gammaproteobacteria bacterium]|nr:accessory factor UbiK family protein [Gammaproteobacteria bacterium]
MQYKKIMIDPNVLDQLTKRLSDSIPDSFKLLQHDLEKNIKASIQSVFRDMDLVTRDEFDIQAALLSRTAEKLKQLEQKLTDLENK